MSSIGRFGIEQMMRLKSLGHPMLHLHGTAKIMAALLMVVINAACTAQPLCVICEVNFHGTADVSEVARW